jgi:long-chain acyl-CoA synthetase
MNVTHGLRRLLQINPNGPATAYGARRRTWRDVGERVSRFAAGLSSLGVIPGDRVAVLSLNSDRYLELYLAVAWAGAVIVPLNIRWTIIENEDALRDCRASVLAVDKTFAANGAALANAVPGLKLVYADDGDAPAAMVSYEVLIARSKPVPDAMRTGADLAGIFYTGGTTGRSKGVMLSHHNLMVNARDGLAERSAHGESFLTMTYLHAAPMFHIADAGATYALLLIGGTSVIIQAFTPETVMAAIQSERVTDVALVPTMIQMLVDHPALGSYDLSPLKNVLYGASPISEALLDRAIAALPGVRFIQAYGMTELSPLATVLHWNEHMRQGPPPQRRSRTARLRGPDRRCRPQPPAFWRDRRNHCARRQCDDGLLGAA